MHVPFKNVIDKKIGVEAKDYCEPREGLSIKRIRDKKDLFYYTPFVENWSLYSLSINFY